MAEVSKGGRVADGNDGLKINKVFDAVSKLIPDAAVQIRGNRNARALFQTFHATDIAAGERSDRVDGDRETGLLDGVNDGPGEKQVPGEGHCFLHADVGGELFPVMTEDDVTELAGQAAPDRVEREILIIRDDILKIVAADVKSDGVLILTEHGNQVISFYAGIVRKIRKRHGKHTAGVLDDRQGDDGRNGDIMEYQSAEGGGGCQLIVRFHAFLPFHQTIRDD